MAFSGLFGLLVSSKGILTVLSDVGRFGGDGVATRHVGIVRRFEKITGTFGRRDEERGEEACTP
jgi:hypothetical protein